MQKLHDKIKELPRPTLIWLSSEKIYRFAEKCRPIIFIIILLSTINEIGTRC